MPMSVPPTNDKVPSLARSMGLAGLIAYGVGDMLGSGIYALIGRAAGIMGNAVWLAFLVSMVAAVLTGLSYASLGSRYPRAAGAAYVVHRAFGYPMLTYVLGLSIIASGLTSFATQARAFSRYLLPLVDIPGAWTIAIVVGFVVLLTLVNLWGIRESAALNAACTLVEVAGLVIVIIVAVPHWGEVDYLDTTASAGGRLTMPILLQGAVLTFYSFVGFEDMINVSEEVKEPRRNFPIAVIAAMSITAAIYLAVSISAVSVVPAAELAASGEPLVEVVRRAAPWFPPVLFSFIALFAIVNTGLLNYIMGSRVLYGLSRQGLVPGFLGRVNVARRTPHAAILVLMVIVLLLTAAGDVAQLASATSVLLLAAFIVVNASLLVLKFRADEPKGAFEVPAAVPVAGIITCSVLLIHASGPALRIAGVLVSGIAVLYLAFGPRHVIAD